MRNGADGIKIQGAENQVYGNTIGVKPGEQGDWSNHANGISMTGGATGNVIGGIEAGQRNVISGNGRDGIQIGGSGRAINRIIGNAITLNLGDGILVVSCGGNTVTQNSIHSNGGFGIREVSECLAAPKVTVAAVGADEVVTGSAAARALVEVYSDDEGEGRFYEGNTTADIHGRFWFTATGGFEHPNVTVTATDDTGNTSEFSAPAHLLWTLLLYLNGDNDLQEAMFETLDSLAAAGPGPRANVLALVDGFQGPRSGTALYDMTRGQAISPTNPFTTATELNMGDPRTLAGFVTWGRADAPARHTLLAIVDHGGGWAPTSAAVPGALPRHGRDFLGGNSGLSWDFSSNYDYLDSRKIREALLTITGDGDAPLDVVFYDVCLMGMLEVAYQIKDYAGYFVSSQNIGWAPVGEKGRYVQVIQGIGPDTTPRQMAKLLVDAYAAANPLKEHPFTVSAIDLSLIKKTADDLDHLGNAIGGKLANPNQALVFWQAYLDTQKLDYNADFRIESTQEGFVRSV